jgi:hypothetical protein
MVGRETVVSAGSAGRDVITDVDRQPIQPGLERFRTIEPMKILINAEEYFLRGFLCIREIAENTASRRQHAMLISQHNLLERRKVPGCRLLEQDRPLPAGVALAGTGHQQL